MERRGGGWSERGRRVTAQDRGGGNGEGMEKRARGGGRRMEKEGGRDGQLGVVHRERPRDKRDAFTIMRAPMSTPKQ